MRLRTRWKAHEVGLAVQLGRDFDFYIANQDWCRRYCLNEDEAKKWQFYAKNALIALRDMGLPDIVLQSLIGFNHKLEEWGL